MRATSLSERLRAACHAAASAGAEQMEGRIASVQGLNLSMDGFARHLDVGDRVRITTRGGHTALAEIIGGRGNTSALMAFREAEGVGIGAKVVIPMRRDSGAIAVDDSWIGRVVDPLGNPMDHGPPLAEGPVRRSIRSPDAAQGTRKRLGPMVELGVSALDLFTTCREGQRLGIFSGPGMGKSTLMSMIARQAAFDVCVIALVGERGREVREFVEDALGEEGLRRAVVVVATSDMNPLMRRDAMYFAMTVAEHFRARGRRVLALVDSLTRYCHALREVALSNGEIPNYKSYPSSVFAELPRVLERAGPGTTAGSGSITGIFSVLVDGENIDDPVANAVRGIIDGHIILDAAIGERGRYPAVDVLKSLSRNMEDMLGERERALVAQARLTLAEAEETRTLQRVGLYRAGSDAQVDRVLAIARSVERLITQGKAEVRPRADLLADLAGILSA